MVCNSLLNQFSHPNQVLEPILQLLMLHVQLCSLCLDALEVSSPSWIAVEIFYQYRLPHAVKMFKECNVKVRNYTLLPQYINGYNNYAHMYKHIASFIIAASTGQNCILMLQRASLCAFVWLQICDCYSKKTYAGGCFEPKMTSEAISGQLVSQFFPKCMPPDSQPSRCMHKHTQLLSFPNLKYLSTPLPYQYTMVNTK